MKVIVDTGTFFQLWKDKEKSLGISISLSLASNQTGLAHETIRNIRDGKTQRFDAPVIAKLCDFLDISPGPIPFIVYVQDRSFFDWLLKQESRDDSIGDFAGDTRRKSQEENNLLPINSSNFEDWKSYLLAINVSDVVLDTFYSAWEEWSDEIV
jgi:DNA-binding Xre family transcriptional regulator/uncharacterized protein YozE (UPF0346 family)